MRQTQFQPSLAQRSLRRILCRPWFGRLAGGLFSNRLPSGDATIATGSALFTPLTKAAVLLGTYEEVEVDLLREHLEPGPDVVELGASLGVVSAVIARRLRPGARLLCVEANPACISSIEANLEVNARELATKVINRAVAYGATDVLLDVGDVNAAFVTDRGGGSGVRVPATTLGALLRAEQIDRYSAVIDIEGSEADLLTAEPEALRGCRQLFIELHETERAGERYTVARLGKLIEGAGFEPLELVWRSPRLAVGYYLRR